MSLWLPKKRIEDLPKFRVMTFICYYKEDVSKFEKLVRTKGGLYEGYIEANFLNFKNQIVGTQYVCIYQYCEPIHMEVLT